MLRLAPRSCTAQQPRAVQSRPTLVLRSGAGARQTSVSRPTLNAAPRRPYGGGHDEHKPVRKPGVRYFTRAEVAEHSFIDDAWIVLHGHVYNITPWIPQHPGGNIILSRAGKDATDMFERIGHSDYAQHRLKDFYIGEVEGDKRHDNIGEGLPWYYQTRLGQDAHRDKSPRPFDFRQPAEMEEVQNFLHGPPLGNTDKGAGKKV